MLGLLIEPLVLLVFLLSIILFKLLIRLHVISEPFHLEISEI